MLRASTSPQLSSSSTLANTIDPKTTPEDELVRFEMTKEQLKETIQQIERIETKLASFGQE